MNWKKWGLIITLLTLILVWQQWPDTKLHLIFCDVGQGDGVLVVLGSFQAMIDTGAYENKIVECLSKEMPFWDRKIELVFLSHGDKDHVGALPAIKKRFQIGKIIDQPKSGDLIRYGSLSFDILKGRESVLGANSDKSNESNQSSVVMTMAYGNFTTLFTGDIDIPTELALVAMGVLKKTDVLKVAHHGSKYGSTNEFLELVMPKLAVISSGAKNNYGHPSRDALLRLDAVGAKVLRTDKMGTITIKTDGEELEVFGSKVE